MKSTKFLKEKREKNEYINAIFAEKPKLELNTQRPPFLEKEKNSPKNKYLGICLWNKRPLKFLNDTRLVSNDQGSHQFATFRGLLFYKQIIERF